MSIFIIKCHGHFSYSLIRTCIFGKDKVFCRGEKVQISKWQPRLFLRTKSRFLKFPSCSSSRHPTSPKFFWLNPT